MTYFLTSGACQASLRYLNERRHKLGVKPLELGRDLCKEAQIYAEELSCSDNWGHASDMDLQGCGETIFTLPTDSTLEEEHFYQAIDFWWSKSKTLKFATGGNSFTQLTWRNSKYYGIGAARSKEKRVIILVARFYPAGNKKNEFFDNVPGWNGQELNEEKAQIARTAKIYRPVKEDETGYANGYSKGFAKAATPTKTAPKTFTTIANGISLDENKAGLQYMKAGTGYVGSFVANSFIIESDEEEKKSNTVEERRNVQVPRVKQGPVSNTVRITPEDKSLRFAFQSRVIDSDEDPAEAVKPSVTVHKGKKSGHKKKHSLAETLSGDSSADEPRPQYFNHTSRVIDSDDEVYEKREKSAHSHPHFQSKSFIIDSDQETPRDTPQRRGVFTKGYTSPARMEKKMDPVTAVDTNVLDDNESTADESESRTFELSTEQSTQQSESCAPESTTSFVYSKGSVASDVVPSLEDSVSNVTLASDEQTFHFPGGAFKFNKALILGADLNTAWKQEALTGRYNYVGLSKAQEPHFKKLYGEKPIYLSLWGEEGKKKWRIGPDVNSKVCWLYTKKRSNDYGIPLHGWYQSDKGDWQRMADITIQMID